MPASPAPRLLQIVVADDDAEMRAYICRALQGRAVVHEAEGGREALRLARTLQIDLVVADLQMPGLGGRALCHALRADPVTAAMPVLLVSGDTRGPPPLAAGFLAKPFNAASLRAAVRRLVPLAA